MTTGDAENLFVDTNVLVYATVAEAPLHQTARKALRERSEAGATLWLSRQVLREFLATLTRPQSFSPPLPMSTLEPAVRRLASRMRMAEENEQVTENLLSLLRDAGAGGKQVHDANIVATMQAHGIDHLLTHNRADFARFAHLITIVPIEHG